MRVYTYRPEQAGVSAWPSGELRLAGSIPVDDPKDADVFVCPGNLSLFWNGRDGLDHKKMYQLPYLKGNEARHVFLDISDNFRKACGLPCMFIRCDVRSWMLKDDPNTIQFAWPVEDFAECIDLPAGGFLDDVSFHGWLSSDARKIAAESCASARTRGLRANLALYRDFYGYIEKTPEGYRRRAEYVHSLRNSRMALCPESIPGVLPYRFFEAMSAARMPVLVGTDYVLPFEDEIPYDDFCLFVDTDKAATVADVIQAAVKYTSDQD
ncbi:MAG TPA: exostosin family protein, partial [Nitrospiraceae bacterium]|nr:exostosin family protein [Nitrospiraceae bacterium]